METENLPAEYEFLFSDSPLIRELASYGLFAIDFLNYRSSIFTEWPYWRFDQDMKAITLAPERIHPDHRQLVLDNIDMIRTGVKDSIETIFKVKNSEEDWIWVLHKGATVYKGAEGQGILYIGNETDITRLKDTERELLNQKIETETRAGQAESLLQAGAIITSSLNIDETVAYILDYTKNVVPYERASVQIMTSTGLEVIGGTGYKDMNGIIGLVFPYPEKGSLSTQAVDERRIVICNDIERDFPKFVEPDKKKPTRSWLGIPLILRGDVVGMISLDHTVRHFYTEEHLKLVSGFAVFMAVALANARHHEETHRMAMEDALMKIGTRYSFELQGEIVFTNAKRRKSVISVAMADIDHFKKVNDTYGHSAGDLVLKEIGRICLEEFRVSDVVARYGGEEIVFMFSDLEQEAAKAVMERLRKRITEQKYGKVKNRISISVGLATKTLDREDSLGEMIKTADSMLYKAKNGGRDRVVSLNCDD